MKRLRNIFLLLLVAATAMTANAWTLPKESLTYNIMYKWGLINKKAGEVTLTTSNISHKEFKSLLVAASAPWADKFFMVRDTLRGNIHPTTFLPTYYERIAHEGSHFSHDILNYTRTGSNVTAHARIWRQKKGEEMSTDTKTHQAQGTTLDMLSAFYYMRQLNYPAMNPGSAVKLNIFSGKKKEILTIHYHGIDQVKLDKNKYPAYHITFTFTQENGKVSSDNMDAWISTTDSRIPLLMEGKLPVGKVRALYAGAI